MRLLQTRLGTRGAGVQGAVAAVAAGEGSDVGRALGPGVKERERGQLDVMMQLVGKWITQL
jgi:hypothetical protein